LTVSPSSPVAGQRMYFKSILYVDDDADICSVVRAALRLVPGLNIQTAESGERAIDVAYDFRPELVLMDVMMPGLDGPSTFERMRQSALLANIPVIFITAKVLPAEVAQLLQLGAIGVIVKPFDPLTLYEELCALWTNKAATHQNASASTEPVRARAQLDALTISFLRRARYDGINLANMIERAQAGDPSVYKEIDRVAHSLHGAGAMFGFPNVSAVGGMIARTVEDLMARQEARGPAREIAVLGQLLELSRQLAQHVEAASQTAPQSDAMFQGPARGK
jgi:two-component system, OmpR family, response regulator